MEASQLTVTEVALLAVAFTLAGTVGAWPSLEPPPATRLRSSMS